MIERFPKEGHAFFMEPQWSVPASVDWVLASITFLLAGLAFWLLTRSTPGTRLFPRRWLILFVQYLFIWLTFGFAYHALFQQDPRCFKLVAATADEKMFQAIEEHRAALDSIREAKEVIGLTVAGLRTREGQQLLTKLGGMLGGEVKLVYLTALSLVIVRPPEPLKLEEVEALALLRGKPEKAEREYHATREYQYASLPGSNAVECLDADELVGMKLLLARHLKSVVLSSKGTKNFLSSEDSQRLQGYMGSTLQMRLRPDERIDLQAANDPIFALETAHKVAMELGTEKIERLVDFLYFSLITIATVGYGDIVPNSLYARLWVAGEILLGIILLVFFVNRFLSGNT